MLRPNQKHTYTDFSPAEFNRMRSEQDVVVLDVRTAGEVAEKSIPGAVTGLDYYNGEFESAIATMDHSKTYLIYCRSGVRSVHACERMAELGFENLYNLRGGILAWTADAK